MKTFFTFLGFVLPLYSIAQDMVQDSINEEIDKQIQSVEFVVKKNLIEKKTDRLVFNVENATIVTGGDVVDALKITPGVRVDNDKISITGKSVVRVLVDGRLVDMSSSDLVNYLRMMKADEVKSIEVITNPPAKYIAEGNSGILNIITKKTKQNAWNASVRGIYKQSTYPTGNWGSSFNFQKNRWTFSSEINYSVGSNSVENSNDIYYPKSYWESESNRRDFNNSFFGRLGLDYKISNRITNGFVYRWVKASSFGEELERIKVFNIGDNKLEKLILSQGNTDTDNSSHIFNYHLVYDIDNSTGKKLSLDYDMLSYQKDNDLSVFTEEVGAESQLDELMNRSMGEQNIQNHSLNIDMEHPLKWMRLNYGARFSFSKTKNHSRFFEDDLSVLDVNRSNEFQYREHIQSLYLSVEKKLGEKWELKTGLRVENTEIEGYSLTLNQKNKNQYTKLFPTAYVVYTPNDNHSFSLDYGKRLSRPNYSLLNPFRWINSPYSYYEGNPLLRPSYTHNIELEYSYREHSITSIYYSKEEDGYESLDKVDANTNIVSYIPENFYKKSSFGINQTLIFKPFKFWDTRLDLSAFYDSTKSLLSVSLPYLKGWNAYLATQNDIILNKNKTMFLSVNFKWIPKGVDVLDYDSGAYQLDASFKMLFLKKKLAVNLYANDILRSYRFIFTGYSNGIKSVYSHYFDQRFLRLSVSYNFGQKFNNREYQNKNQGEIDRVN